MKTVLCYVLVVVLFSAVFQSTPLNAQEQEAKDSIEQYYLNFGSGGGTGGTLGVGFNLLQSKKKGINIGYRFFTPQSALKPSDYSPGLCLFGNCTPLDYVHIATVAYKMNFKTPKRKIFYGFETGPALVFNNQAHFTPQSTGWFGSNYKIDHRMKATLGLSIRGVLSFHFLKRFGMELAGFTNVNFERSIAGAELYWLLGRLR